MIKDTIIIIDTDSGFVERFKLRLEEQLLIDKYQIHTISPNTTLDTEQLIQYCLTEVQKIISAAKICGIFVDIVIVEKAGPLETTGINIASNLKTHFPNIPIFNITRYCNAQDADIISEATLEDNDGVLAKDYLEGKNFSPKRLSNIFTKAITKREKYKSESIQSIGTTIPATVRTAFNFNSLDPRVKYQIQEIGESQFWNLLVNLLPNAEGTISYMQPGRSGAYVFKVVAKFREENKSPTRPKGWVIKVTNKKDLLELEVKNYKELKKTRVYYPKLFHEQLVTFNNLAGIAFELEEDSISLLECFAKLSKDDINNAIDDILSILEKLYGDADYKQIMLWKDTYSLKNEGVLKILSLFEENEHIIHEKCNPEHKNRIIAFVSDGVTDKVVKSVCNFEVEADMRNIHGDFNSRNILVNNNKIKKLVLIDFSAMQHSHIAKDIAKLERDIVFRVFDAFSANYYDWDRIKVWKTFMDLVKKDGIFSPKQFTIDDIELQKSINFIYGIRNILKQLSPKLDEKQYLCALLHFSLLALTHPEISIQKKIFGIQYINNILENFD